MPRPILSHGYKLTRIARRGSAATKYHLVRAFAGNAGVPPAKLRKNGSYDQNHVRTDLQSRPHVDSI
jgi:hypothetical protein